LLLLPPLLDGHLSAFLKRIEWMGNFEVDVCFNRWRIFDWTVKAAARLRSVGADNTSLSLNY
jgi:hypothetical protein